MLRQSNTRALHWVDKTLSVLRADQLEACEKDLAGLPSHCVFDPECSDQEAETLYALSYYAEEDRRNAGSPVLHTAEELRSRVLHLFSKEAALLSVDEHVLMVRAVLLGGVVPLSDWNDLIPARGLVRRLWGRVEGTAEKSKFLLPHQLCAAALLLLTDEKHKEIRELISLFSQSIEDTLYLMGASPAAGPMRHLAQQLKGTPCEDHPELINRFLLSGFDYVYDRSGGLLLIHPGLAEPEKLMGITHAEMDPQSLNSASASLGDLESPLYERLVCLLDDVTRPEISSEDAVEDLIILAKQDVSLKDMTEVLSSMLICRPTPEMLTALMDLSVRIPRWINLSTSRVQ